MPATDHPNMFMFATVFAFVEVTYPEQHLLAWVRTYDEDHVKRVASLSRKGRFRWIETSWIKSLFEVLTEGRVKLIVMDVNIFA